MHNRKGAIELSISTVVIIVLGMTLLIGGIIFVNKIISGATGSVDTINDNVKAQINKLFNDQEKKVVILLPDNQADVKKGESFGIAFGIKNTEEGVAGESTFTYNIKSSSIQTGCSGLSLSQADSYVILGKSGSVSLSPGSEPAYRIVKIQPSDAAPLCEVLYDLNVQKNSESYSTEQFIVKITG